ncbi:MAG: (2Fe-2S) ferredoxin domain-containing protein [Microcoleaceae cyanobacterium]
MLPERLESVCSPSDQNRQVLVCQYQSCQRQGSEAVLKAFEQHGVPGVTVECSGCQGQCNIGPSVRILPDETWYYRVKPEDVTKIVEQHLQQNQPVTEKLNPRIHARYYSY